MKPGLACLLVSTLSACNLASCVWQMVLYHAAPIMYLNLLLGVYLAVIAAFIFDSIKIERMLHDKT
jgi:hypothetical protein